MEFQGPREMHEKKKIEKLLLIIRFIVIIILKNKTKILYRFYQYCTSSFFISAYILDKIFSQKN